MAYQQVIIGDTTNSGGTVTSPAQFILMVNGQFAAAIGAIAVYSFYPFVDTFASGGSGLLFLNGLQAVLQTQTMTAILSDTVASSTQTILTVES